MLVTLGGREDAEKLFSSQIRGKVLISPTYIELMRQTLVAEEAEAMNFL